MLGLLNKTTINSSWTRDRSRLVASLQNPLPIPFASGRKPENPMLESHLSLDKTLVCPILSTRTTERCKSSRRCRTGSKLPFQPKKTRLGKTPPRMHTNHCPLPSPSSTSSPFRCQTLPKLPSPSRRLRRRRRPLPRHPAPLQQHHQDLVVRQLQCGCAWVAVEG